MRDKQERRHQRRHQRTHRHSLEGYNLWVWEQPSWRVIATYPTSQEAHQAAKHAADPRDTWTVAKVGSQKDEHMRQHCTDRMAPLT